jgi:plasmid stability protein
MQPLIRDLQDETVQRLKSRAERNGRSLQGEV